MHLLFTNMSIVSRTKKPHLPRSVQYRVVFVLFVRNTSSIIYSCELLHMSLSPPLRSRNPCLMLTPHQPPSLYVLKYTGAALSTLWSELHAVIALLTTVGYRETRGHSVALTDGTTWREYLSTQAVGCFEWFESKLFISWQNKNEL